MSAEIRDFLATTPVFADVPPEQLDDIAGLFQVERYPAGWKVIRQGGQSSAVYFVKSGRMAVRINREDTRETVAQLQPPDIFGELSFITGKACIADVEVEVDAELLVLPKEAVSKLPERRDAILRGLLRVTAERLQRTVVGGAKILEMPVLLLRNGPRWEAPSAFAESLAESLARQTERDTLLVHVGPEGDGMARQVGDRLSHCSMAAAVDEGLRARMAEKLTAWKKSFQNVLLNPVGPLAGPVADSIGEFSNFAGFLLGPGDEVPADPKTPFFVAQSAARPTLAVLDGNHQLVYDADSAAKPTPRFQRTVDSLARHIAGIQVGVALGGGAAWGWAHIGVLGVIEKAGLPVDVLSGCSMGSVVGAFRAAGKSVEEMAGIAEYWRTRTKRFIEWRLWRMCLVSEAMALKTFGSYFLDRGVNQTETPYWANAVDIRTGKEFSIRDGTLVQCIRASIALPGLLPPLARDSCLLVDAGIMDPVPVKLIRRMGADFAIAVNAMSPIDEGPVRRRYPFNAFDVMARCMFVMGHEIGQARAEAAADVVMAPPMSGITMLEFARSPEIIERGRRTAAENLDVILARYQKLKRDVCGKSAASRI
jgi:NTE family protein